MIHNVKIEGCVQSSISSCTGMNSSPRTGTVKIGIIVLVVLVFALWDQKWLNFIG